MTAYGYARVSRGGDDGTDTTLQTRTSSVRDSLLPHTARQSCPVPSWSAIGAPNDNCRPPLAHSLETSPGRRAPMPLILSFNAKTVPRWIRTKLRPGWDVHSRDD